MMQTACMRCGHLTTTRRYGSGLLALCDACPLAPVVCPTSTSGAAAARRARGSVSRVARPRPARQSAPRWCGPTRRRPTTYTARRLRLALPALPSVEERQADQLGDGLRLLLDPGVELGRDHGRDATDMAVRHGLVPHRTCPWVEPRASSGQRSRGSGLAVSAFVGEERSRRPGVGVVAHLTTSAFPV